MTSLCRCFVFLSLALFTKGTSNEAGVLFSCSFERDSCGMVNQAELKALWKRTYLNLGGRSGYAMAVTGNEAAHHFARFMTPDLDTEGRSLGCLSFRYFIDGLTPASLACIKQGAVTKYVFATARKTQDHWAEARIELEFLGDTAMFYFEADTRVQQYGNSIVAFTDVRMTDKPCTSRSSTLRWRKKPL